MTSIIIYLAISMLFGIISCFFGRKLYFPIMMLTVFIAVVSISFSLFDFTAEVVAITCIVGIIAALLAKFIYKLGVFLMGCLLGASFGNYLPLLLPQLNEEYYNYIVIIVALIIGFFALKWCDVLIMASTAYNGARIMAAPLLFIVTE